LPTVIIDLALVVQTCPRKLLIQRWLLKLAHLNYWFGIVCSNLPTKAIDSALVVQTCPL